MYKCVSENMERSLFRDGKGNEFTIMIAERSEATKLDDGSPILS